MCPTCLLTSTPLSHQNPALVLLASTCVSIRHIICSRQTWTDIAEKLNREVCFFFLSAPRQTRTNRQVALVRDIYNNPFRTAVAMAVATTSVQTRVSTEAELVASPAWPMLYRPMHSNGIDRWNAIQKRYPYPDTFPVLSEVLSGLFLFKRIVQS